MTELNRSVDGVELKEVNLSNSRKSSPIDEILNEDDETLLAQLVAQVEKDDFPDNSVFHPTEIDGMIPTNDKETTEATHTKRFRPFSDALMASYLQEMYNEDDKRIARENGFEAYFPSEGTVPRERYSTRNEPHDNEMYYNTDDDGDEDDDFNGKFSHLALDNTVSEIDESEYADTEIEVIHIERKDRKEDEDGGRGGGGGGRGKWRDEKEKEKWDMNFWSDGRSIF